MLTKISDNLKRILKDIENYNPTVIAVTKYHTVEEMEEVFKAGLNNFGENRVMDAIKKIDLMNEEISSNSNYHLIGHLQSNKAKKAVGRFDLIQSLDSYELCETLDRIAGQMGIVQKVLVQVNNAHEEQKSGIAPSQLEDLIIKVDASKNLSLEGLMTIAPLTEDEALIKKLFDEMYKLKETYHQKELSMGMSNDYKIALDSGATMIRLGRILFN